jgi:hypothetical protein
VSVALAVIVIAGLYWFGRGHTGHTYGRTTRR